MLSLATPRGIVTWRARGTSSTIDLAFLSQDLENRLLRCTPRTDLTQLSDHVPIELTLDIRPQQFVTERKRNWKKMDIETLRKELGDKVINTLIYTNE